MLVDGCRRGTQRTESSPATAQAKEADAEGENDPQFEPVIKLEQQVETKTHEEDEEVLFKMYVGDGNARRG